MTLVRRGRATFSGREGGMCNFVANRSENIECQHLGCLLGARMQRLNMTTLYSTSQSSLKSVSHTLPAIDCFAGDFIFTPLFCYNESQLGA